MQQKENEKIVISAIKTVYEGLNSELNSKVGGGLVGTLQLFFAPGGYICRKLDQKGRQLHQLLKLFKASEKFIEVLHSDLEVI